jgi:flagellar hook-associated protein 1 FlgK
VQQSVISAGQNLADSFNSTASAITSAQSDANGQVTQTVSQINTLTSQIAKLNGQVAQLTATGQDGGTVEDQRDELVQQLSKLTGVSVTQSSDGETITTGSGTPLVMGDQSFTLQTTTGSDGAQHVLDSNGTDITSSLQGGTLGGAIQVGATLSGFLTQLNTLASGIANNFNNAQEAGYGSNGNSGQAFFTLPSNSADAASGISVGISDPSLLATGSGSSSDTSGNIANLSDALTKALPSGQTASAAYSSLVFQVGNAASTANDQSTAIGLNLTQLTTLQGSESAVDTNEEATNLLRFQTAYEAAARIISTVQQLNTVTLNMGTSGGY